VEESEGSLEARVPPAGSTISSVAHRIALIGAFAFFVIARYSHVHDGLPHLWSGDEPLIFSEAFRMLTSGSFLPSTSRMPRISIS
jgi:hypothetical protein